MQAIIVGGIVTVENGHVVKVEEGLIYGIRSDSEGVTTLDFSPFVHDEV